MMRKAFPFLCLLLLCLLSLCLTAGCEEHSEILPEKKAEPSLAPTTYDIRAELSPEDRLLRVETAIGYSVPSENLGAIKLRLYANAYAEGNAVVTADKRKAAYGSEKEDFGGAKITNIDCALPITGSDLGQGGTVLTLRFGRTLEKGERLTITIAEEITIAKIKHRLGFWNDCFSLADFYPEICPFREGKFLTYDYTPYGDPYLREASDFTLDLRVPCGYECAASAHESRREIQGTFTLFSYALSGARDFACVTSPKLTYREISVSGLPVRYYFEKESSLAKTQKRIQEAVALFGEAFGAFPYPSFSLVTAPFFEAGVEHSGLAVISDALSDSAKRATVLHETAHQWWQGKVGNDEYLSPWVDEGLAEYSVAYFYKVTGSETAYRTKIEEAEDAYAVLLSLKGTHGARFDLSLPELSEDYYDRVYCGGLLLFSSLAEEVGTERFVSALRAYAEAYAGETASPSELIASLSRSLGKDYSDFFTAWISGVVPIQ